LSASLGHEIIAVLAVVAAFFSGLALGSWTFDRPLSVAKKPGYWYAGMEIAIGLWALSLSFGFPWANRLAIDLMGIDPGPGRHWAVALLFPFILLLPATFAMGGTLPAMERLLSRLQGGGRTVGGLYAANTFGAVAGTLAATFWITPALGFQSTQLILAGVNFICAGGMFLDGMLTPHSPQRAVFTGPDQSESLRIHVSIFATGLLGIGYEVLVVRALSQILENTVYSFAGLLSVYLLGTALGGAVYQLWSPKHGFRAVTGYLAQGLSLSCLAGLGLLLFVEKIFSGIREWLGQGIAGSIGVELCTAAVVLLLPTILMGMTFSHLAQGVCGKEGGLGRALSINTVGAAIAPVLFGVVLLPAIGLKAGLVLVAAGYLMLVPIPVPRTQWMTSLVPAGLCGLFCFLPHSIPYIIPPPNGKVVDYREGVMASVSVVEDVNHYVHLKVNNHYQMGGTSSVYSDRRQAHIPLLLHPEPKKALFLGLGTGATFAAAADHPGLEAVAVELVPEVIDVLPHFESVTGHLNDHPRLRIEVADARRYVNTDKSAYDVIVADLFHPSRDGAAYLYTVEHFQAVKKRLAPGGVFCQWLPIYQLDLSVLNTIIRTYLAVFPDASAYLAHFSLTNPIIGLVGGGPLWSAKLIKFDMRVGGGALKERLKALQLRNVFEFLGCYLAGAEQLGQLAGAGPLNTDDCPVVMFEAPRFVYAPQEPASKRLIALIDSLAPVAADVLPVAEGREDREARDRLAAYWAARNRFLHAGVGVPRTGDLRELLTYVREPLLEVVRMSPDFDPAYRPLLAMAQSLVRIDPSAGRNLVVQLIDANPGRSEARRILGSLTPTLRHSPDPWRLKGDGTDQRFPVRP
ncbi:MAG: fused MFS/spermidine synthase, partial [Desulfobacterales bacterium]